MQVSFAQGLLVLPPEVQLRILTLVTFEHIPKLTDAPVQSLTWRPLENCAALPPSPSWLSFKSYCKTSDQLSQSPRGLAFKPKLMALAPLLKAPACIRPIHFAKA